VLLLNQSGWDTKQYSVGHGAEPWEPATYEVGDSASPANRNQSGWDTRQYSVGHSAEPWDARTYSADNEHRGDTGADALYFEPVAGAQYSKPTAALATNPYYSEPSPQGADRGTRPRAGRSTHYTYAEPTSPPARGADGESDRTRGRMMRSAARYSAHVKPSGEAVQPRIATGEGTAHYAVPGADELEECEGVCKGGVIMETSCDSNTAYA
jgi:hypothetical protein